MRTPSRPAAATARAAGSFQSWNARLNVAQCTGTRSPPPRSRVRLHDFLGVHVDVGPGRTVGAEAHERRVEGSVGRPDRAEPRKVPGVAAVKDAVARSRDDPGAPERRVAVRESAPREVPRGRRRDRQRADGRSAPPSRAPGSATAGCPTSPGARRSRGARAGACRGARASSRSPCRDGRSGRARSGRRRAAAGPRARSAAGRTASGRAASTAKPARSRSGPSGCAARRSRPARRRDPST